MSSATIRNVIADLEQMGLVSSPHTSAGRVPTVLGYRLFVDTLLSVQPLEHSLIDEFKLSLGTDTDANDLADMAGAPAFRCDQAGGCGHAATARACIPAAG